MLLTDVMTYLMKGTLTNIKGVLRGDGKTLGEVGVDSTPTAGSENLITSGGVKSALDESVNAVIVNITRPNSTYTTVLPVLQYAVDNDLFPVSTATSLGRAMPFFGTLVITVSGSITGATYKSGNPAKYYGSIIVGWPDGQAGFYKIINGVVSKQTPE